jgi:oligopeptide/dipeptide ABC transporter ATP-binding protein
MSMPPNATASLLAVEDLTVQYSAPDGDGDIVKAVDGVSFAVVRGETFGIIGESGSGKSTLGRAVVGLLRPNSGRLRHEGVDPFALGNAAFARHRRDFQIIFQDAAAALNPRMTIGQSVREPLDIAATSTPAERTARVGMLLADVGLAREHAARYPHELSGGQNQRATIARALALNPKLIVCDEVVAPLDVSIQADILNLFAALQSRLGLTYIFITHDLGVAAHISDRIAVMYLGKFVELASAAELMAAPLHPYTQALLSAEPVPAGAGYVRGTRIILSGEIPSATDPPSGCRFRTRCWLATDRCAREEPLLRQVAPEHLVACHFAETTTSFDPTKESGTKDHRHSSNRQAMAELVGTTRAMAGLGRQHDVYYSNNDSSETGEARWN